MSLRDPIAPHLGVRQSYPGIMYGIELEYERLPVDQYAFDLPFWSAVPDGSLRNSGIEFVSQVLAPDHVDRALAHMSEYLSQTRADPSSRCGVHLHLNATHLTIGQMYSFVTLYAILEPSVFLQWCQNRVGSSFCVPLFHNQQMTRMLHNGVMGQRTGNTPMQLGMGLMSKYSAINLAALLHFGTIEMRHLPATLDFERLRRWIDMFTQMMEVGTRYEDPLHVINLYESFGLGGLQRMVLGEELRPQARSQRLADNAAIMIAGNEMPHFEDVAHEEVA